MVKFNSRIDNRPSIKSIKSSNIIHVGTIERSNNNRRHSNIYEDGPTKLVTGHGMIKFMCRTDEDTSEGNLEHLLEHIRTIQFVTEKQWLCFWKTLQNS